MGVHIVPHCVLEYTSNIVEKQDNRKILLEINNMMAGTGLFNLADIKSRVIVHDDYVIGEGSKSSAFVALDISILTGRDTVVKKLLSQSALDILKRAFSRSMEQLDCSVTVRITEMEREVYQREKSY